jgi:hypothetical protein
MPPVLKGDVDQAAKASGVSRSLYVELLFQRLRDNSGQLPVLVPSLEPSQEARTTAA